MTLSIKVFLPVRDFVLLECNTEEDEKIGNILVPQSAQRNPLGPQARTATVEAVGPDCKTPLAKGDVVFIMGHGIGMVFAMGSKTMLVCREHEIIGKAK